MKFLAFPREEKLLVERLRECHEELKESDQLDPDEDNSQTDELAAELLKPLVLESKNNTVRQLAGCCLSDVLRIYAPDAPYSNLQLKLVFQFLITRLRGLVQPATSAVFKTSFYILEKLETTRSCCILVDLRNDDDDPVTSEELVIGFIEAMLDAMVPTREPAVEVYALRLLTGLLDELEGLSPSIMEALLTQLLPEHAKASPKASLLVEKVVKALSERIREPLSIFIHGKLTGTKIQLSDDEDMQELKNVKEETDLEDHIQELIFQLFKIEPSLLLYILPQLALQLEIDDIALRKSYVDLIGNMFMELSSESFIVENRGLWSGFLRRIFDVDSSIRLSLVQFAGCYLNKQVSENSTWRMKSFAQPNFFSHHSKPGSTMVSSSPCFLQLILDDKDPEVREEAVELTCAYLAQVDSRDEQIVLALTQRISDKKIDIARTSVQGLLELYQSSLGTKLEWIPEEVLKQYLQQRSNTEESTLLHWTICSTLISCTKDMSMSERSHFWNNLWNNLSDAGVAGFKRLFLQEPKRLSQVLTHLIDSLFVQNPSRPSHRNLFGNQRKSDEPAAPKVTHLLDSLTAVIPMSMCPKTGLSDLLKVKDKTVFKILKSLASCNEPPSDIGDLYKRLGSKSDTAKTFKLLFDRMFCFNAGDYVFMLGHLKQSSVGLLHEMLQVYPEFSEHPDIVDECEGILLSKNGNEERLLIALKTLKTCKKPSVDLSIVRDIVQSKSNSKIVKTAVEVYVNVATNDEIEEMFDNVVAVRLSNALRVENNAGLAAALAAFSAMSKKRTTPVSSEWIEFTDKVMRRVMDPYHTKGRTIETEIKRQGIKLIGLESRRLIRADDRDDSKLSKMLLLIRRLVADAGNPWAKEEERKRGDATVLEWPPISDACFAELRLEAACSLLKIEAECTGSRRQLMEEPSENLPELRQIQRYLELSRIALDPEEDIRETFVSVLNKHMLLKGQHLLKYGCLLVLAASQGVKSTSYKRMLQVLQLLHTTCEKRKRQGDAMFVRLAPEMMLPFVVYVVAHHPALPTDSKEMAQTFVSSARGQKTIVKPLTTLLDGLSSVVTAGNAGMLYRLLDSIRLKCDRLQPESENIHMVTEIARMIVNARVKLSPETLEYPGVVMLPMFFVDTAPVGGGEWPQSPIGRNLTRALKWKHSPTAALPAKFELHGMGGNRAVNKAGKKSTPKKRKSPIAREALMETTNVPPKRRQPSRSAREKTVYQDASDSDMSD